MSTSSAAANRAKGLLLGLGAADRNGGPMRLAVRIAEAAVEQAAASSTSSPFDVDSFRYRVARRYLSWQAPSLKLLAEPESAYDTGAVFEQVFNDTHRSVARWSKEERTSRLVADASSTHGELLDLVDTNAATAFATRASAGVGAAHRVAVLAAVHAVRSTEELAKSVRVETTLTHLHPEAVNTAIVVTVLCRHLILRAMEVAAALSHDDRIAVLVEGLTTALPYADDSVTREVVEGWLLCAQQRTLRTATYRDGRAPMVLDSALYFLFHSETFREALLDSLDFAGPANYCPVLVGSIGGALWGLGGSQGVNAAEDLNHREAKASGFLSRLDAVSSQLAQSWVSA